MPIGHIHSQKYPVDTYAAYFFMIQSNNLPSSPRVYKSEFFLIWLV